MSDSIIKELMRDRKYNFYYTRSRKSKNRVHLN